MILFLYLPFGSVIYIISLLLYCINFIYKWIYIYLLNIIQIYTYIHNWIDINLYLIKREYEGCKTNKQQQQTIRHISDDISVIPFAHLSHLHMHIYPPTVLPPYPVNALILLLHPDAELRNNMVIIRQICISWRKIYPIHMYILHSAKSIYNP